KNIPLHRARELIENKSLKALAVTATNYYTSNAVTFVQADSSTEMWKRKRRVGELTDITVEHLMASSAIPFFFPSVEIDGRHFGDGCLRNTSPISPAVQMGADKIIAIGVRQETEVSEQKHGPRAVPSIAHISGVLLDAVLLDSIELDMVRLKRINEILDSVKKDEIVSEQTKYRPLRAVWISPTEDIGAIASSYYRRLPKIVRYMLKGLGPDAQTTDIVSFLLFDPTFCSRLIELGYHDGIKAREDVLRLYDSH
ncbi:MAG: patatin-like phospholipase family protein, partial [Bdellovibrionales bacterium]|nr:patatin-like phospholipase family protein [Bdellovibrionales bacterium]